ncbi:molecular chaperone [Aliikangiella sp. IMCC44359]|uniref:molecular chaperone n=1 Tax=Aliikangiella sp. IMCC44359 TaxID=3459125 RepID=UPI00403B0E27
MFAGLDFGTSNSAIGIISNTQVELLSLYKDEKFLPSTLYTLDRNAICEFLFQNLTGQFKENYKQERLLELQKSAASRRTLGIESDDVFHFFGKEAIKHYIELPEEGIFIKSPKSFLGSTGLSNIQIRFFEDLVSAMMLNIKQNAESQTQKTITQVVIGRPINFQGVNSEKSNHQAIEIMTKAAQRCGYQSIEFLFEPLAAGIDFETHLVQDKVVLVIDIGGGTTDCSMVKMGPSYINQTDRTASFLAHTGQRIGGNDLDIQLAYHALMPLFGLGGLQKKGLKMPNAPFWSTVSINHVGEQTTFNSQSFTRYLKTLKMDALAPELIERLISLQASKQNHHLVHTAELAKIALSDSPLTQLNLNYIEANLIKEVNQTTFESSVERPLKLIQNLIKECLVQAATKPDTVYITGGSAKSPSVRKAITQIIPNVEILDGDYYGSVASGLTKWAYKIWQ